MANRLADALSPYLQQHAHNPVDWYEWGPEALERARAEDRPILLSIGYSACHWCHVMEHESFDDARTAALMNEQFVSIKVDREERPDLDQIYQLVVQLMHRRGGWPLTVFLTPSLTPFFAGTYFPPEPRHGMPDFRTVLRAAREAFDERRDEVERSAREITAAIEQVTRAQADPLDPPRDAIAQAAAALRPRLDPRHGGFGDRPKFPNTMALDVLLRAGHVDDVERALTGMRDGGIHDQLGGGFHRYSTDARWLVPHFEKMLYDNALLLRIVVDTWRVTDDPRWADTARRTVAYALREMRGEGGLFYSSQDADSEGEEGRFFVWTPAQLVEVLGEADAAVAARFFGVTDAGNFEDTGASVLHVNRSVAAVADALGLEVGEVEAALDRARAALFEARERRPKPFRDEKAIASWNGLMIGALADAGAALAEPAWVAAARESLRAARDTLFAGGALRRLEKDGVVHGEAFLEDWADLANAALDVHRATLDDDALGFATALVDGALERFHDEADGGFFFAAESADRIVRAKDAYDNAVPSGTSSIVRALLALAALTGEDRYARVAERTIRQLAAAAIANPLGFGHLLGAIDRYLRGPLEVDVIAAGPDAARPFLEAARRAHAPDLALRLLAPGDDPDRPAEGPVTAYVCRDRVCSLPLTTVDALRDAL